MDLVASTDRIKKYYLPLFKSRQTLLLTLTGEAGYLCHPESSSTLLGFFNLVGSLLVSIAGCTVLNMLFDRDLDRQMERTGKRPLAAGLVDTRTAALLGGGLIALGLAWSVVLSWAYFLVILAGVALNVVVYTLWLKRRSAWSILLGGLAGGMPILAGYTLARGVPDLPGLLLALVIICWIPGHNLTLNILYSEDYLKAGVPTFGSEYGLAVTLPVVAISNLLTSLILLKVIAGFQASVPEMILLVLMSSALVALSVAAWVRPVANMISIQYKYSSIYMLVAMVLLALNARL